MRRPAEQTQRSPVRHLIVAAFLMDFYLAMVGLAIQNLGIHALDAPNIVLGLFATCGSFAYAMGCLFSGSISDRFGRRRIALTACLGCAVVWATLPNLTSWKWVLCVAPLGGAFMSLYWPSIQAWLAEVTPGSGRELNRALGLFNVMWCSGLMLGPIVTGYLWNTSCRATFYLPASLLAPLALLLFFTPAPPATAPQPAREAESSSLEHEADPKRTEMFLRLAWIGSFASWFGCGTVMAMFPKLGHELALTTADVGWTLAAYRLGQLAMFIAARHEHRWQYRLWPMCLAQVVAGVGLIGAVLMGTDMAFKAGFALAGCCTGLTYIASLFYALHGRSEGRGKRSGFHEAVLGSGIFTGPLVAGLVAQTWGLKPPFFVAGCVLLAASALQVMVRKKFASRGA